MFPTDSSHIVLRSVGCTVIELLEGRPPYHFLSPMPALFRIVQDDCPPIPDGVSPIVKDFLYHCFQKDCNLRVSAKKLLRHPWMVSARKQMAGGTGTEGKAKAGEGGSNTVGDPSKRPVSNYNYDEAVLKVQEWNEALKCELSLTNFQSCHLFSLPAPSRPSKHPARGRQSEVRPTSPLGSPTDPMGASMMHASSLGMLQPSISAFKLGSNFTAPPKPSSGPIALVEKIREPRPLALQSPEEEDDNWDDDFEEGISFTKLQGMLQYSLTDAGLTCGPCSFGEDITR